MKSRLLTAIRSRAHPEVVGNGARRLRRFNLGTPLRSGNFDISPIQTPKRAEARAPTDNFGMHGAASQFFEKLRDRVKAPNSKLQAPKKDQPPSSKTDLH